MLGAAGFVGSHVADQVEKKGVSCLRLGRSDIDLLDENASDFLQQTVSADDSLVVISAEAPVKNNQMLERNIRMIANVCSALEKVQPRHVIYVSSDAVYADSMQPLSEDSCAQPGSLHGVMHLAREVMLANAYSGPLGIIRPTLIFGATDPHNGYGPNRFRRLAAKGNDIILFGEGEEKRDHILVDDVAELIVNMLWHRSAGVLNAATGNVHSFREIADMVVALFEQPVKVQGSERVGQMPHNGYRPFDPTETFRAFPDFNYTELQKGLELTHSQKQE